MQATVDGNRAAWVAYVFAGRHWGRGYAAQVMVEHLGSTYGVVRFLAMVEAQNQRSVGVFQRLGFHVAIEHELEGHQLSPTEILFLRERW